MPVLGRSDPRPAGPSRAIDRRPSYLQVKEEAEAIADRKFSPEDEVKMEELAEAILPHFLKVFAVFEVLETHIDTEKLRFLRDTIAFKFAKILDQMFDDDCWREEKRQARIGVSMIYHGINERFLRNEAAISLLASGLIVGMGISANVAKQLGLEVRDREGNDLTLELYRGELDLDKYLPPAWEEEIERIWGEITAKRRARFEAERAGRGAPRH